MEINTLVEQACKGDSQAFAQLYDLFAQKIFKYVRIKIQDRDDAQDILQEVFIKAYKGLENAKDSKEILNFSAWLYTIASNTINDYFRKKYRTPEILTIDENLDLPSEVSPSLELDLQIDMGIARKAFAELSPLYRQILELRYIQEFSLEEILKILGKTNLAIRLIQFRALRRVKIIIKRSKKL